MKTAAFNYHRPSSVAEALAMREAAGEDARFLAGGQSLVPMMSLRLAQPSHLIDLNSIEALSGITQSATHIQIGAMTRQQDLAAHEFLCQQVPALRAVVASVGHPGTRTRGTLGGSLCHADPAAELPAVLLAVDAEVELTSLEGATRHVKLEDFFAGYFETTIRPDEMLTSVRLPIVERRQMGFDEVTIRSADFATAGAIVNVSHDADGALDTARVVTFALGDRPCRHREIEAVTLETFGPAGAPGARSNDAVFRQVAQLAGQLVAPTAELHLSADYQRQLGVVVVRRALEAALRPHHGSDARPMSGANT